MEAGSDRVKLFVGLLPRSYTEGQLLELFSSVVPVVEVCVLKDPMTKQGKGCGFVVLDSKENADRAIAALNDRQVSLEFPKPIQVRYADGELQRLEYRLFVGMIPKTVQQEELRQVLSNYGTIVDLNLLSGQNQEGRAFAFVRYANREQAVSAIANLDGKVKLHNASLPLVVKFADTEKDKMKKMKTQPMPMMGPGMRGHAQMPMFSGNVPFPQGGQFSYGGGPAAPMGYGGHQQMAPPMNHGAQPMHRGPGFSQPPTGPLGANLFVYQIPPEFTDNDLRVLFAPYGMLLSTHVFIDKHTGLSKGFGFVSYDNPLSAAKAIQTLDGFMLGTRKLKVQLKTEKKPYQPY